MEKYKILFFISVFILLGITYYEIIQHNNSKTEIVFETNPAPSEIMVDVSGAVNKPGVYSLSSSDRIGVAIERAGGISNKANATWVVSTLNLSQKLVDAQKIYIPFEWEDELSVPITSLVLTEEVQDGNLVNLNTATSQELQNLSGIGEVYSSKIIESRPYSKKEDLLDRGVVSKSTWDKISQYVQV